MTWWELWGKDGFDPEAEPYKLDGAFGAGAPSYETEEEVRAAAADRLAELDISQPLAGGQIGIQDRVYVRHPDGHLERVFSGAQHR